MSSPVKSGRSINRRVRLGHGSFQTDRAVVTGFRFRGNDTEDWQLRRGDVPDPISATVAVDIARLLVVPYYIACIR
jgi:hypothetical protein